MNIDFYKNLFDNINQPILVMDSSTAKIVDLNDCAQKFNIKKEMTVFEAFGKQLCGALHEETGRFLRKIDGKISKLDETFFKWEAIELENCVVLLGSNANEEVDFFQKANELDQKFKSIFDNSMIGYLIISVNGKIVEANKAFCNMLGYSHKEIREMKLDDIVCTEEKNEHIEIHRMMSKGLLPFIQTERRFVCKTGSDLYTVFNSHTVYNDKQKPVYLISTVIDITDKKEYDNHIQSVARFTEENPFPVMRVSKYGEITYFNKAVYEMAKLWNGEEIDLAVVPSVIKDVVVESIENNRGMEKEIRFKNRIFNLYAVPVHEEEFADVFARDITEIRKGEEIIKLSEERFRAIFNSSYRFVGLLDTRGKIIEINQTALDFGGVKHHDVVNTNFWEMAVWGNDRAKEEKIKNSIEHAAKGNFIKFETDIISKTGSEATIMFSIKPVKDSKGNVILLIPEGSDITDMKIAKREIESYKNILEELVEVRTKELAKRENFLATIFKNIPYIITIRDAKSKKIISINEGGMKMLGTGKQTVWQPMDDENVFGRDYAKINREYDNEVISKAKEIEIFEDFIQTAYGQKVFHTKKIPIMIEDKLRYVMSISEDITFARKAQQRLRILSEAIEHNPAAVVITNSQGTIEYVNPKHTEITGYSYSESVGRTPAILNSGYHDREYYKDLWDTIRAGKVWKGEFFNKNKAGKMYWERASISPIHNNNGDITAFVAVKEDITDIKMAAEQLKIAKEAAEAANKAKSAFIANMSHEIRTPMNAVLGFAQILKKDSQLNSDQRQNVDIIFKSGEHLLGLITDILEMSKIEAGKVSVNISRVDISKVVDDVETIFRKKIESKEILFVVEKDVGDVTHIVKTDESKIRQILINFLGNSVKFTKEGYIKLVVKVFDDIDNRKQIRFSVIDTGVGIKKEEHNKLFKSFEQTESGKSAEGGTGLGLAICKQYADMLGAKIEFESEYLKGSSFSLILSAEVEELHVKSCELVYGDKTVFTSLETAIGAQDSAVERDVPEELKEQIREAVFQGYTEQVKCRIGEVLKYSQKKYEKLNKLFINYDYDGILSILDKKE